MREHSLDAIALCNATQHRHDAHVSPQKRQAKRQAAELLAPYLGGSPQLLDIGAEGFYREDLPGDVTAVNLPMDMHELAWVGKFDAAVAMHVLEHSPMPLVVLLGIYDALRPGGVLYVATPPPVPPFDTMPSHWTVMPAATWERLIRLAGFEVLYREQGEFGDYPEAVEDRWLAWRP